MVTVPPNGTLPSPAFSLGQLLATPGALEVLKKSSQQPTELLNRHAKGDWGELSDDDRRLNDEALHDGGRILSAYSMSHGVKLWVITEAADSRGLRAATTILLPDEY